MVSGKHLNRIARAIVVILPLSMWSCQKAAPVDPGIGDEEYRVMTATLKYFKFHRMQRWREPFVLINEATGKPDTIVSRRKEKPLEFRLAPDTTKGRVAYNLMMSIYGDISYYLTVCDSTYDPWIWERSSMRPEDRQLHVRGQKHYRLDQAKFGDSLIVRLVDDKEFSGPEEMYSALPLTDGRIRLSRVGFSPDSSYAVMYHFRKVHPVGGVELLVRLQKSNNSWVVVDAEEGRNVTGGW